MRRVLLLFPLLVGCAGASKAIPACEPLAPSFGLSELVYPACALDARPRVTASPRPDLSRLLMTAAPTCYSAEYDIVIAPSGKALPETAKLVRTTHQPYAEELKAVLANLTYSVPRKDGQAVYALVRYEGKLQARVMSGGGANRAPPC